MRSFFVRFITDCADADAILRLGLQGEVLFGTSPTVVQARHEIEAAGLLIDALDITDGAKGVIFVNIAPRNGDAIQKWKNGIPFGHFYVGKTLIVSTVGPTTLSLVGKWGLTESVSVLHIPEIMSWATSGRLINHRSANEILDTQFRSLFFAPLVARWILDGRQVPVTKYLHRPVMLSGGGHFVWFVDCFGNLKTTLWQEDLELLRKRGNDDVLHIRSYRRLSDVPEDGKPAWVTGSSGFGERRFMELVVQGDSAAKKLGLSVGSAIVN